MTEFLEQVVDGVTPLRAALVTAMPDCLLFDSWIRERDTWTANEVATYLGDLVRSNRAVLKSLGSWSSEMQVTIESAEALLVVREVNEHFVVGCIFDRATPLGMVRLHMNRMLDRIAAVLPQTSAAERPRSVRIVDFLHRYAPDPHAVLMRVSLRAAVPLESLNEPARLTDAETERVENAARRILGLDQINV